MTHIEINGSMGEGGGAILRLGASFSILFNKSVIIKNIRAKRPKPGLRAQHLAGLVALKELTDGNLSEAEVGTMNLIFSPGSIFKNSLDISIKTAGSVALLAQTLQFACIKSKNSSGIEIKVNGGGTFGLGAPDPYFLNNVTYKYYEKMGYKCNIDIIKEGFYPKGGAMATLLFKSLNDPSRELRPLMLNNRGSISKVGGFIIVSSNLKKSRIAERIRNSITNSLVSDTKESEKQLTSTSKPKIDRDMIQIRIKYVESLNPGVGLSIWAEFENDVVLSSGTFCPKRSESSEYVGKKVANLLLKQINTTATVDSFLADQIIPLLFLCKKKSSIKIPEVTSHMQTNIELIKKFTKREYRFEKLEKAWKFEVLKKK